MDCGREDPNCKGNTMKYNFNKVEYLKTDSIIIHKIAETNPEMNNNGLQALAVNMRIDGFNPDEPLVLWGKNNPKLIDGRSRLTAAKLAGIDLVPVVILSHYHPLSDVKKFVARKENRRHQTVTQRAIMAYRASVDSNLTQGDAAVMYGVNVDAVSSVSKIMKMKPELIDELFKDNAVSIGGSSPTTSVRTIVNKLAVRAEVDNNNPKNDAIETAYKAANRATGQLFRELSIYELQMLPDIINNRIQKEYPEVSKMGDVDPDEAYIKAVNTISKLKNKVSEDTANRAVSILGGV